MISSLTESGGYIDQPQSCLQDWSLQPRSEGLDCTYWSMWAPHHACPFLPLTSFIPLSLICGWKTGKELLRVRNRLILLHVLVSHQAFNLLECSLFLLTFAAPDHVHFPISSWTPSLASSASSSVFYITNQFTRSSWNMTPSLVGKICLTLPSRID
jgi:hypothetical protein